ncbi:hypothetical protein I3215_17295 [Streptomyces sp. RB110-1]|uniref:hypothetical protein n=1 Tax=unclassified Streptomyces TaxID=2593676 RepID=UPI0018FFD24A|nr:MULTISPECIES: hypothetical protein [unclassified Streptomyces]MBK0374639.1 hypothetical protein [Streptomyces sp. RB110-1]MBK0388991.1 hypothetical protein [Streptomyces sp. RB110-2]
MNRRLSMALTAYGVGSQALFLVLTEPLKEWIVGFLPPGTTVREVRVFGLSFDGFALRASERAVGWVPQAVFLTLGALLLYGVFRASAGVRPRARTVLALVGASLLAAGAAVLITPALDLGGSVLLLTYDEWVVRAQMGEVPAAAAQFALITLWLPLIPWVLVWRYRDLPPLRAYFGTAEGETEPAPRAVTGRARRHLVCAGLIPAVLLAVAGGQVLRHARLRHLSRGAPGSPDASITFDPDLWVPYTPPPLVAEWSGVLYPALRLRPLRTEMVVGWAVTLVVCAVFLTALALALRSIVTRSGDLVWPEGAEAADATGPAGANESADAAKAPRPTPPARPTACLRLVLKGWYATLLAAVLAAFVDGRVLHWLAPRRETGPGATDHLGVAIGDAVRFGAAWGWATGIACLAVVLLMRRRAARTTPPGGEGEQCPVREDEQRSADESEEQAAHGA